MNKTGNNLSKSNTLKINSNKTGTVGNTKNATTNASSNRTNTSTNKTNTSSTAQPSAGYSGTNVIGIVIMIFVLVIIAGASYWLYNYYTTKSFQTSVDTELLSDITDASGTTAIPSSSIPSSS